MKKLILIIGVFIGLISLVVSITNIRHSQDTNKSNGGATELLINRN
jgi:hypothetical protein